MTALEKFNKIKGLEKLKEEYPWSDYKEIAANDIRSLSWVKYRIQFRTAFYDMADEIKKGE